jgi:hypothetical protein
VRILAILTACGSLLVGSVAFAAPAPRAAELAASLNCVEPMTMPLVENVMEAKWSPDSTTLALVWFAQLPSSRSVTGYREQEIVDTLDMRTGALRPLGVGDEVDWSGTGQYASYWGPNGDELRVAKKNSVVVARLAPTIPRIAWVGDGLLFVEKNEIREWREGAVHTIARLEERFVPKYPKDDLYFSADGTRFTLTRYSLDGTLERYLGLTRTGEVAPLVADGARYVEWAPTGATLLLRYLDRIELRDVDGQSRTVGLASRGLVHAWSPDGVTLLLGRVSPTVPAGNAYDPFRVWDTRTGPAEAMLPNLLGARTFSPDGKYFVGVSRTGRHSTRLEVYRCGGTPDAARPDPDAPARLSAIEASGGRLVRPTSGEISQFLQGSHTGIDVATPFGELITADDDGVITFVDWVAVGGNRVCVQHSGGLESCAYHTSAPLVSVGERVARGQPVALIGMTGVTTGPHTHWETKLFGRIVDPLAR